ncbi:hypothetical protein CEXT_408521 [Caerostris extrusa]|uniref:Uncharacterized protein n=1 Tax=Caerostris extrusa TaxID=172846 RepID=A0AAV4STY2_CAEEX|nr:hypothetical protein CEXT_408521 [Caerostris extrusa]
MRVDENQIHVFQYLEQIADKIDHSIIKHGNEFNVMRRSILHHNLINLKKMTIYGCIARVPVIVYFMKRIRVLRERAEYLQKLYERLVNYAVKYQHPTLLDRLERQYEVSNKKIIRLCETL